MNFNFNDLKKESKFWSPYISVSLEPRRFKLGPLIIVIFIYYKVNAYRVIKKWIGITALKILKIILN